MSTKQEFIAKVAAIQLKLKSPKSQRNSFGNYNYRNQEDILEAVKPLLSNLVLSVSDEIVEVGGRVYVKATSTITDGENAISNTAFAREPEAQKGMNEAQITGSASSYARKYSLNGLFLIDDTKDADSMDNSGKEHKESPVKQKEKVVEQKATQKNEAVQEESKSESEEVNTRPARGSFRRRGAQ
jgi:hypothetical protein